ncbi:TPA: helix-turn-helix transcriptional regulator [Clostridioides difficile]|uniref:helix-turn-helix transcriptional regulator n=1 Tax=Clostridioides difficile TaxID=1496 RepID=UPI0005166F70|nr:helix-turn-helix transcriptional regulator [Clostridioides difficile]EGT4625329.1 XRE family transcriptional regulator [Clostridioides difficile]ELX4576120.1 helix-turn-helix transcriptional regulator [Clostridioides difficile]MBH6986717.1 helix-turn-helix transcriptional regulator [Clostridioides difficile]MBH7139363.1 helix-turn-helix transcriptional regulator [Clostridioides difficile]MBY1993320.1 helix-turn-helix domain-containing protein [Clostridioides difficile]
MKNRLRDLRKGRRLTQEEFGEIISVTQQNISKYENDVYEMPIDVLVKISQYFNVSIEYLLGLTEIKRDIAGQVVVNKTVDEYYDLVEAFKTLGDEDQELIWSIIEKMKQIRRRKE